MIAILNLLTMGAGGPVPVVPSSGQQSTVLEACSSVDVSYEDLGIRSSYSSGFHAYGTSESKYRRIFTLNFVGSPASILTWIDLHYRAYIAGGGLPFQWVRPKTTTQVPVKYKSPPNLQHSGSQGGNAGSVILREVFQTD